MSHIEGKQPGQTKKVQENRTDCQHKDGGLKVADCQQPETVATYHQHQLKPATGALMASLTEALPVLLPGWNHNGSDV